MQVNFPRIIFIVSIYLTLIACNGKVCIALQIVSYFTIKYAILISTKTLYAMYSAIRLRARQVSQSIVLFFTFMHTVFVQMRQDSTTFKHIKCETSLTFQSWLAGQDFYAYGHLKQYAAHETKLLHLLGLHTKTVCWKYQIEIMITKVTRSEKVK